MNRCFKLSILFLYLIGCSSVSDRKDKLNSFMEIPWGSSPEFAKEIMFKKDSVKFSQNESNDTLLFFDGGQAFGEPVRFYGLHFTDGQLYEGSINFHPPYFNEVLPTYLELKSTFIRQYGKPNFEKETVDPSKNNKEDLQDLSNGKGWMQANWHFPVSGSKLDNGLILLLIKGSEISVSYVNADLGYANILKRQSHKK